MVSEAILTSIRIITSENRFEALKVALEEIGITGMTVRRVLGYGHEKGHAHAFHDPEISSNLLPKLEVEIVVSKIPPEKVVETATKVLHTGKFGDGKIFINKIDDVVKIRTGERGYDALQDET